MRNAIDDASQLNSLFKQDILFPMEVLNLTPTIHKITFNTGDEIFLIGTAHISKNSVEEVKKVIEEEEPDRVCIELDEGRMKTKSQDSAWQNMDIKKVFKEGKGFLLLANTALASFQKRMGAQTGSDPGKEILGAAQVAKDMGIPVSLCDREIQVTFKRAWAKSNFWNKCKLLATLISSAFSKEKISEEELEKIKNEETMEAMLNEVSKELPSVKEVLIDERDRYLATSIYNAEGHKKVAVIGAGHTQGIIKNFSRLESGELKRDASDLNEIPKKSKWGKVVEWIVPTIIILLLVLGVAINGWDQGLRMFLWWVVVNVSSTLLFTALSGGSVLTTILSGITAPFFALNPVLGVGIFAGIMQATFKKPRVKDFESMSDDAMKFSGWYRNRILRCLLVFLGSSIGSMLGSLVAFPLLISHL